jgi:hypothetical protein
LETTSEARDLKMRHSVLWICSRTFIYQPISIIFICASYEVLFMKYAKAVYDIKDKTYQNFEFPFYFRSENVFFLYNIYVETLS